MISGKVTGGPSATGVATAVDDDTNEENGENQNDDDDGLCHPIAVAVAIPLLTRGP